MNERKSELEGAEGHTRRRFLHGSSALIGIAALSGGACSRGGEAASKSADEALDAIASEAKNFTATEFRTLTRVADLIIPETDTSGALGAKVPAFLDGLMSDWASEQTQGEWRAALAHIDAQATADKGKAFAALSDEEQHAMLTAIDAACFGDGEFTGEEGARVGYRNLKQIIFHGYYLSEIGCEQELQFELVPGPDSRGDAPLAEVGRTWAE